MVVLCLVSPDFAICSLALHKHVVSVVVSRLSTFASLALSTLAPMFVSCKENLSFHLPPNFQHTVGGSIEVTLYFEILFQFLGMIV